MISSDAKHLAISFREWASNFSEKLFVMIKVYSDVTGTHDGADVVAVSGLIESVNYWGDFNRRWNAILNNFDADYFHYREFRKSGNTKPGDPYYGWSDEKRRNFIFKLAMLSGASSVPIGGAYAIERNTKLGIDKNPYEETIRALFQGSILMLNKHWPEYDGKVLFIFATGDRGEWTTPLHQIHGEFENTDSRIGGLAFEKSKDPLHRGLEAADLCAIHWRNFVRGHVKAEHDIMDIEFGIIDFIVSKNIDPVLRKFPRAETKKVFSLMRRDEAMKRRSGFKGTYEPREHFDFEKYGYPKKISG